MGVMAAGSAALGRGVSGRGRRRSPSPPRRPPRSTRRDRRRRRRPDRPSTRGRSRSSLEPGHRPRAPLTRCSAAAWSSTSCTSSPPRTASTSTGTATSTTRRTARSSPAPVTLGGSPGLRARSASTSLPGAACRLRPLETVRTTSRLATLATPLDFTSTDRAGGARPVGSDAHAGRRPADRQRLRPGLHRRPGILAATALGGGCSPSRQRRRLRGVLRTGPRPRRRCSARSRRGRTPASATAAAR